MSTTPAIEAASDVVLDVNVTLALEVGRARMAIRDFLQLAPGSVVELERPAGDPLDVYVNNRLVARGEVVMVNDRYGVRFTEAMDTAGVQR
ncbi:MAG: flagellar motor switch protein FliN [Pseudomonadota bacterium]|jgi:flagellar motor switch protein FliN/FliY|nr:MAG: flagellar motor switch protein FliN [Pseudomonadota bacterium]